MDNEILVDSSALNSIAAEKRDLITHQLTELGILPKGTVFKEGNAKPVSAKAQAYQLDVDFLNSIRIQSALCDLAGYAAYQLCITNGGGDAFCRFAADQAREVCEANGG